MSLGINQYDGVDALDLCCGSGGLALGAKWAGLSVLLGVDNDKNAIKTFSKNFPDAVAIRGDVSKLSTHTTCENITATGRAERKQPLVLLSGPPCQGFSVAGRRIDNDPRNKILIAVAKAISRIQPDGALVENVTTILDNKHSTILKNFYKVLLNARYNVIFIVLDASEFGIPQRRRRVFFFITKQNASHKDIEEYINAHRRSPQTVNNALADLPIPSIRPEHYIDEDDNGNITNHFAMRHSQRVIDKINIIRPGTGPLSYRRLDPDNIAGTLISGHRAPPAHYREPRSITVREAARLQGFPDSFKIYGNFGGQMQQVANAVPPPLAEVAIRALIELMTR